MKIDYEITVDVSGADVETKKRVQDAFFKLGITWAFSSKCYEHLGKALYTNRHDSGEVVNYLTWCYSTRKPTHTIDQLFELAGMKTEKKLIPFDLEKALAGDPVVTRDGREVSQVTLFECNDKYPLMAVIDGEIHCFTKQGVFNINNRQGYTDLFMKPKTRIINGFEVPAPVKTPLKDYSDYYMPAIHADNFYLPYVWADDSFDKMYLERGLVFLAKEDAIANAKAMLGINPHKEQ